MKRVVYSTGALLLVLLGYTMVFSDVVERRNGNVRTLTVTASSSGSQPSLSAAYTLIGWNDLGMHCISPRFKEMSILPPYNNLMAQVIQKGDHLK